MIVPYGSVNLSALGVPGVTVQIIPPAPVIGGLPTDFNGTVGIANWGPVNSPTVNGGLSEFVPLFGAPTTSAFDLGTQIMTASFQGASNFVSVRVTDGTDVASSCNLLDTNSVAGIGAKLTAKYTGTLGNTLNAVITAGSGSTSGAPTFKLTIYFPGQIPEVFDNIGGAGAVFWANLINAVNLGQSGIRGPSNYVIAALGGNISGTASLVGGSGYTSATISAGGGGTLFAATVTVTAGAVTAITISNHGKNYPASGTTLTITGDGTGATVVAVVGSTTAPALSSYTFSGGTSGNSGVTAATLVGTDGTARTGMYALRGTLASVSWLADCTDTTQWSSQVSFGLSEGQYMMLTGAAGQQDGIAAAVTAKQNAGIDSYAAKVILGDWCYIQDNYNNVQRLVSPQGFFGGKLAVLSPQFCTLNQPMYGIIATQKTAENKVYSSADILQLEVGGLDVIQNPSVQGGASIFGAALGNNSSSNNVANKDNYTRMINFMSVSVQGPGGLTPFIGQPQTPYLRIAAQNALDNFFLSMAANGMIGDINNPTIPPFSVQIDANNNPSNQVVLGFMQATIRVVLWSIVQNIVVNLQAGGTGTVTISQPQPNF